MVTQYKDIKTIAKEVRQELVRQYPKCTWSVRIERFSGGQSLKVALLSAPFEAFAKDIDCNGNPIRGYAQLNHYQFRDKYMQDDYLNNGTPLTKEAWDCMATADRIANGNNWDNSDPQTDYFDVNYWLHLEIGNWDKPFVKAS